MKTSLLLTTIALLGLALGAASTLQAAAGADRREFQLGNDPVILFDPRKPADKPSQPSSAPATPGQPGATQPGTTQPSVAAAPAKPSLLIVSATPPPAPTANERRNYHSATGGLVLNPEAAAVSGPAPAAVPGSRREFKVGGN
jgi:hypothetical protein